MLAHSTAVNLTDAEFTRHTPQLTALIDDWVDRECSSFDDMVRRAAGQSVAGPSIWDMPMIDSKRVVSLLTELEPVLERRLPATLIRKGGYSSAEDLKTDLVPKLKLLAISGKAKPLTKRHRDVAHHHVARSSQHSRIGS